MYSITCVRVSAIVFNATFNNISVISWWSSVLVFNYLKSKRCNIELTRYILQSWRRGHIGMVIGFIAIYCISAYLH
jgi:hypothetical protein